MASKDHSLYGLPRPKKSTTSASLTTSTNLSFSAALSSLISKPSNLDNKSNEAPTTTGRARPSKHASSIFTTHNRNAHKRAAADMLNPGSNKALKLRNQDSPSATALDDTSWRRTKRKMEEKARLYAAMKRGDVQDDADRHMVDFDRKWAETQHDDAAAAATSSDDDDASDGDDRPAALVDYVDEFGRTRRGTAAEAALEQRRRATGAGFAATADLYAARPAQPSGIIFGDTIQAAAFDPDAVAVAQMEALAGKRDRALTPPPETHYDAGREVRSKGTGFFAFSADEEERKAQMEGLEREREETERQRGEKERERGEREEARRKEIEDRRRLIKEKRDKMQAERFLESLGKEMDGRDGEDNGT